MSAEQQKFRRELIATLVPILCEKCLVELQETMGVKDDELADTIVQSFGESWVEEGRQAG
jgi:hypothetical protein